jgi:hypothetical protein
MEVIRHNWSHDLKPQAWAPFSEIRLWERNSCPTTTPNFRESRLRIRHLDHNA